MCGRYSSTTTIQQIQQQFGAIQIEKTLPDNYNVAPTQRAYVITNESPEELQTYHWGLLPFWSKEGKLSGRLINARSEGIEAKPSFRLPVRKRRCLVLADSFYEWRTENGKKLPYRIYDPNTEVMTFAGIWEHWNKDGQSIHTFSIITTEPNAEMRPIHNRMPVILSKEESRKEWLLADKLDDALSLLKPLPDGSLELYRVSTKVNSVRNNGEQLHKPATNEKPPSLFAD
ncbi:MAG: SOS response-associated peptidase [Bacteroidota bacterium]